jgi:hypothetical protein
MSWSLGRGMIDMGQSVRSKRRCLPKPERTCHFCKLPIPDDEKAIEAIAKNGWAHFDCWYDGPTIKRDPRTGRKIER